MMDFDPLRYASPSRRNVVTAAGGMVASSHPLAAELGRDALKAGGNAVDAAVTAAVALTMLEPTSNGIGGDCFALVWSNGELHGLNASGWSPAALHPEHPALAGRSSLPRFGWLPVTVPGAPAGWNALSERFGRIPFKRLLQPVIELAERGFPVAPTVGAAWKRAYKVYSHACRDDSYRSWFELFAPGGRPHEIGEHWRPRHMPQTLRAIAESGGEALYRGELAEKLVRFSRDTGGLLSSADLADYRPEWVEPLGIDYRGVRVWEPPPNGQGLTALLALGLLAERELAELPPERVLHMEIEAMKLAFADTRAYLAEPAAMPFPSETLLDPAYLRARSALIGEEALEPAPGSPPAGGTVYLAAADGQGTMVSFIQSNYMGFGSGLVVPETGIALQNRGCNFSLAPGHPNRLAPRKRPYHTIMPGFLSRGGRPLGPFGVMGGFMQPQGHLQVVHQLVDEGANPQDALDRPRWQWMEGLRLQIEPDFDDLLEEELRRRGHLVERSGSYSGFGRGQVILRDAAGTLWGGTEKRCDGAIAVC